MEDVNEKDGTVERFNGTTNGKKIPFASSAYTTRGDLFSELKKHLEILFADQSSTRIYHDLISDLDTLAFQARGLSPDGQINEEQFTEARQYVYELMDILTGGNLSGEGHANNIHKLLYSNNPDLQEIGFLFHVRYPGSYQGNIPAERD